MLRIYKSGLVSLFSLCVVLLMAGSAQATELITNGGFEAGFTSWTTADQAGSSGSWFVASGTSTPLNGLPTAGPASGTFYAVTDQRGPGAHALIQQFTVPFGATSVLLSFDMFANDWAGVVDCNGHIDYTVVPSQCARVDILSGFTGPFDTGFLDLATYYAGADAGSNPNPYTHYSFDISSLVSPGGHTGGVFQLRFAEVDNQGIFNQGVDNVSILASGTPTPEPGTLLLFGSGLLSLGGVLRRKINNR